MAQLFGNSTDAAGVTECDVLIVGGSLVGLSMATFLGWHGVDTLVVEKHQGTAIHPRAGHFHLRTIEAFRSVGLEARVMAESERQFDPDGGINAVETLAGREIASYIGNLNEGVAAFSPTKRLFMTQQSLEPLLRDRAEELGARLNYATELVSFEQDEQGVTAVVRHVESGKTACIRARYMIAADGNRSPIREQLGIAMRGHGLLSHSITIYFRADCSPWLANRNLGVIYVLNQHVRGFFRMVREGTSGFLVVNTVGDVSKPEATRVAEGITIERCVEIVRQAIGVPDLAVEIEDIAPWLAVADVADHYRSGNVFLIGDAAHVVPPTGGFGGNTGVQDAHNLAWKLASVLKGEAGPAILDTYEQERRPVGALTIEQAYTRYVLRIAPELGTDGIQPLVDELSMEIGYRYRSPAILTGEDDVDAIWENPRTARGRPGSRAPHINLLCNGDTISTLDLCTTTPVLLAGPDGGAWCKAAVQAAERLGVDLEVLSLADGELVSDPKGEFADAFDVGSTGAVLLRPDGFVAWRARDDRTASRDVMMEVLAAALCVESDAAPAEDIEIQAATA
ncbi:MAG: FAD-dependent monooxygenase [Sphingomonadales bacterium]